MQKVAIGVEVLFELLLIEVGSCEPSAGFLAVVKVERELESEIIESWLGRWNEVVLSCRNASLNVQVGYLQAGFECVHLALQVLLKIPCEHIVLHRLRLCIQEL